MAAVGTRKPLVLIERGLGRIFKNALATSLDSNILIRVYYSSILVQQGRLRHGMQSIENHTSIRVRFCASHFWMSLIASWIAHSLFPMPTTNNSETQYKVKLLTRLFHRFRHMRILQRRNTLPFILQLVKMTIELLSVKLPSFHAVFVIEHYKMVGLVLLEEKVLLLIYHLLRVTQDRLQLRTKTIRDATYSDIWTM